MKGDGLSTFAGLVLFVLLMLSFASSIRAENLQDWDRVSTDQKAAAEASLIDTWLHRMAQTGQFLHNHPQVGGEGAHISSPLFCVWGSKEGRVTVQSPRRQVEGFRNLGGQGLRGKATSVIVIRVIHLEGEKGGKPSSFS